MNGFFLSLGTFSHTCTLSIKVSLFTFLCDTYGTSSKVSGGATRLCFYVSCVYVYVCERVCTFIFLLTFLIILSRNVFLSFSSFRIKNISIYIQFLSVLCIKVGFTKFTLYVTSRLNVSKVKEVLQKRLGPGVIKDRGTVG